MRLFADEKLPHDRLDAPCRSAERLIPGRHIPPAQHLLTFFANDLLKKLFALLPLARLGRQEHKADAILPLHGKVEPEALTFLFEKGVGRLQKNAGAVAGVLLAAAGPAMFQIDENLERLLDNARRPASLEIHDEADSAGIVLVPRIIQALLGRNCRLGHDADPLG